MKREKAAAFLAAMFLTLAAPAFVSLAADTEAPPALFEVSPVFGEIGKAGDHIPLAVTLSGQSAAPFSGSVCVSTLESTENGEAEVYRYEYPVTLGLSETKTLTVCPQLGQRSGDMLVSLNDGNGSSLGETRLSFDSAQGAGRLAIAALSDAPERLSYLDNVNLDYGIVSSSLLAPKPELLPDSAQGLELLDLILISDFDAERLSEEQENAILDWVRDGGILLFGTGAHAGRTLSGLAEHFVAILDEKIRYEDINMGTEYSREAPGDSDLRIQCADIEVPHGRTVLSSDGMPLLSAVGYGRGTVGFFAFDPGDILQFATENPGYPIRLLTELIGEDRIRGFYYTGSDEEYWNAQGLVNTGNAERLPNLALYAVIIIVYLLLVGPGSYLFLKKRELNRYYGRAVTALSLVFAAVVWLAGMGTRFTSEFYTCASILDRDGEKVRELTYLNARTPDARMFSAELDAGYEVSVLTRDPSFYGERETVLADGAQADLTLCFAGDKTALSVGRSHAFEPRYFRLERRTQENEPDPVSSDLCCFGGKLYGSVTNGYPFTLRDSAVILHGQALLLGDLAAGETREFSGEPLSVWLPDSSYLLARKISGAAGPESGRSDREYLDSVALSSLYSAYIGSYYGVYTDEARLSGFGPQDGPVPGLSGTGHIMDGHVLYTSKLSVTYEKDGLICRSGLYYSPKITSPGWSSSGSMTIYGSDPVTAEYFLGEDIEVESLSFFPVSQEFLDDPGYGYLRNFSGRICFYNNGTGAYDEVDAGRTEFSAEELSPYLTPENSIVVRYAAQDGDQVSYSMALPLPMVTGRVR